MSSTTDVITLAEAYELINVPSSSGHDKRVERWITAVSERLDELCGPVVIRTRTDEAYDGGVHRITLRKVPTSTSSGTTITTVKEYSGTTLTTLTAETAATKPTDGYLFEQEMGWLRRRSAKADATFPSGRRNVLVTYDAGRYANTASVAARFKETAGEILNRLFQREAGSWGRGADPFDDPTSSTRFFRAISESLISEWLADELLIR